MPYYTYVHVRTCRIEPTECAILVSLCRSSSPSQQFVWSLLSVVAEEERSDLRRYLHRALEVWSKQGKLTQPLVKTVCSHTANQQHEKVSRGFLGGHLLHI